MCVCVGGNPNCLITCHWPWGGEGGKIGALPWKKKKTSGHMPQIIGRRGWGGAGRGNGHHAKRKKKWGLSI